MNHAKIENSSIAPTPVPSDQYSFTCSTGNQTLLTPTTTTDANLVTAGMEVQGTFIAPGTFVTQVAIINNNYTFSLNKSLLQNTNNSFFYTFQEVTGIFIIDTNVYKLPVNLAWNNCYSFGNGLESDRIRDDFNAPQIDNGVKASSVFLEYGQEDKTSSIIYSGLYNSVSGVNDLNQFNMAEKITKDLNTTYGSIQAIKARDNDVVVFTEDKVLKVMSSGKDVLFNAGGNAQLTSTNRVLGTSTPFAGDYGISKNPESLATDAYRMYFADKQRGAVLRLSGNGITPISDVGMKGYFREKLKYHTNILGTFDGVNDEYNITLLRWNKFVTDEGSPSDNQTVSFNEKSKGWISFKSFVPTSGVSIADRYYTTDDNKIYKHYVGKTSLGGDNHNVFYGTHTDSSVDVLFNESASSIKSFKTVGYEGSQSRVLRFISESYLLGGGADSGVEYTDGEFYNLNNLAVEDNVAISKRGWHVTSVETNLQKGFVPEFIEKEGKWFNYIRGINNEISYISVSPKDSINIQGLGSILAAPIATGFTPQQETTAQATDVDDNVYPQTLSE